MPRNNIEQQRKQYKKVYQDFVDLQHQYKFCSNLRTIHKTEYRKLLRYKKKLRKLASRPDITPTIQQEVIDEVIESMLCDEQYCDNCLRKQSPFLLENFGDTYRLQLTERSLEEIGSSYTKKFKFSPRGFDNDIFLCQECESFLVTEHVDKIAKSSKNTWPSFILSTLINKDVISHYGTKTWQLIPIPWRHWWIDNLKHVTTGYENISIDSPEPIIIDRSFELKEWNTQIESQMLFEIAKACNKFMIPNVLYPWGCNEFIFWCEYISIDIVFQRFLRMVSLNLINNIEVMKYFAYCRDDYIRFNGDYECLLLNKS